MIHSLTHSLLYFVTSYYSQPFILESTSRKSLPKATFKRTPFKFAFKIYSFFLFYATRSFLSYFSLSTLSFIFCFFVSPILVFQLLQLACTVYLLNILFVLFQRGLPQINKLISSPSFSYFFLLLLYPFDFNQFSSLSVVSSILDFGGSWESAVRNAASQKPSTTLTLLRIASESKREKTLQKKNENGQKRDKKK